MIALSETTKFEAEKAALVVGPLTCTLTIAALATLASCRGCRDHKVLGTSSALAAACLGHEQNQHHSAPPACCAATLLN